MKKLLLALLAVGTFTAANAQKNSILAFGTLGFNVDNDDLGDSHEVETIGFNINPGVGYQFTKHWTVGLQGGFMRNSSNFTRTERVFNGEDTVNVFFSLDDVERSWSIGPFVRYTHNFNNTFSVFGQLEGGYISGYAAHDIDSGFNADFRPLVGRITDEFSGFRIGFFPALAINVHEGLALNFSFGGINYQTFDWDNGSSEFGFSGSNLAVTFGNQFNVGITKNFACKKKHRGHAEPGSDLRRSNDAYDDEDESPKKKKAAESDDDDE